MHNNFKQNIYSRYADNRDVISLFSGARPVSLRIAGRSCGRRGFQIRSGDIS